jgi:nickel-dependent lactate racemase
MTTFTFGEAVTCELALGDFTHLAPDAAMYHVIDDPAAAIRAALAAPMGYPPLAAAVVPGDRVAVAVGKSIPHLTDLLRGVIAELLAAGIEPADVTVVSAAAIDEQAQLARELSAAGASGVQFEQHNPDDDAAIAVVGVTAARRPLRLNRTLAEADLVLPIARARAAAPGAGAPAKYAAVFPQFSNRETLDRFHGPSKANGARSPADRTAESDEAGWLLGVGMTVGVVPGPRGAVAAVLAGEPAAVARAAAEQFQAIWEREAPQAGDLVIAALPGDAAEQTWDNLARAVGASERVLMPDGAIAVCCELEQPPSGAFDQLVDAVDFAAVATKLRHDSATDARPAMILAQALDRGPVYLRSRLPDDVVESLGMTPIASDAELARLASGRRHCVVIEEAQRVRPRLIGGSHAVE